MGLLFTSMNSRKIIWFICVVIGIALLIVGILTTVAKQRFLSHISTLAPLPPMGWNGWNHFGCKEEVNETLIKEIVLALKSSGMRDVGYEYVVLDDCWQIGRDTQGNIIPDPKKFPSGMRALGDYIHKHGMKFGIYTSAGRKTCEKREGSYRNELRDVQAYASWGVDYIKVDWCGIEYLDTKTQYEKWRRAIEKTGRPIVLSIAIADIEKIDNNEVWKWGRGIGHLWRTARDVLDYWPDVLRVLDRNAQYAQYSGPHGWNDADMLQVGNGGMTDEEYKSHFSMWAMMASPLMAGNDVRFMQPRIKKILTNYEVIAIDQDPLGIQGTKVFDNSHGQEIWKKQLAGGKTALAMFNRADEEATMIFSWDMLGVATASAEVRNAWSHDTVELSSNDFTVTLPSHGVEVFVVAIPQ